MMRTVSFFGAAALIAVSFFLNGCGSGAGGASGVSAEQAPAGKANSRSAGSVEIIEDTYGLSLPKLSYASDNASFWSLQTAIAKNATDGDYRCIFRIDVPHNSSGVLNGAQTTFSIGGGPFPDFPGAVYIFNGHPSTTRRVDFGTITFSRGRGGDGLMVTIDVFFSDHGSRRLPSPQYRLKARISTDGRAGEQAVAASGGMPQENGEEIYLTRCAACHTLGDYHSSAGSVCDLSQMGGELPARYPGDVAAHQPVIPLNAQEMGRLRVALNAH